MKTKRFICFANRPCDPGSSSPVAPAGTRPAQALAIRGGLWEGLGAGPTGRFHYQPGVTHIPLSPANPFVPTISEYLTTSNPLCCFISTSDFISAELLPDDVPHPLIIRF